MGHGVIQRLLSFFLLASAMRVAQENPQPQQIAPIDLVRLAVTREVAAANQPGVYHMFRSYKKTPKGTQTHLYVETSEAMGGMLIAANDQPLNAQQQQAEKNRLYWLSGNPDQLKKKRAREKDDAERTLRIVRSLPYAFRFEYAPLQPGDEQLVKSGEELVRLNFTPNPTYSPPSRVEQVLQGMRGYLLIDATARRIARIDGTLFRDVSFGWGIVGHLDKGGHFVVRQAEVGGGSWEITEMSLQITGKILLLKSINMTSDEKFSDFQPVPNDLTFAKGVDLLLAEQEKLARNAQGESQANKNQR